MTIAERLVDYEGFCAETKPDQGPVFDPHVEFPPFKPDLYLPRTHSTMHLSLANTAVNP